MLTLNDIIQALNLSSGADHPALNKEIAGVSIDTRTIEKGVLFIAILGEDQDGHKYVDQALKKGALAAIVSDPDVSPTNATYFRVSNTKDALNKIALKARSKTKVDIKIAAITGSVGKTTLKEFVKTLIESFGSVVASQKSYNNHIGVPLTLAHLEDHTDFGVFEIGMNQPGEIEPLVMMVRPDVAVITAIEAAHIGNMGSIDGIAQEKSAILHGLNGCAILPFDSSYFEMLKAKSQKFISVGTKDGSDFQLLSLNNGCVEAKIYGEPYSWKMNALGDHYALLALFALATVSEMGIPLSDALRHVSKLEPLPGRGKIEQIAFKSGTLTLIDDSYNANIASMKAGLKVLSKMEGRKVAILGGMRELGSESLAIHQDLEAFIKTLPIDLVFTIGEEMAPLSFNNGLTLDAIKTEILGSLRPGDVILLKGSNGNKLWEFKNCLNMKEAC